MAELPRIVRYILAGDASGAVRAFQETGTAAEESAAKVGASGKRTEKQLAGTTVAAKKLHSGVKYLAGITGIAGVAFGIKDAIKAGQEWQQQQAQLQNALRNTGLSGAENLRTLNEEIDRSATHGGFTPAEEAQSLTQFISLTRSTSKAIQLNREAIDFARRAHVSYSTAVRAVSQIQTGSIGRWQKYLGIITPVKSYEEALTAAQKRGNPQLLKRAQLLDKQATAAKANALIQRNFAGAAETYSKTAQGSVENAQHAFDILAEQWGKVLLPVVTKVAQALAAVAVWVDHNKRLVLLLVEVLGPLLIGYKLWTMWQAILDSEFLASGIPEIIIAVAALAAGIYYLSKHTKELGTLWRDVWGWVKHAAEDAISWVIRRVHDLTRAVASVTRIPRSIIGGVGHFLQHPFGLAHGGLVRGYGVGGVVGGAYTDTIPAMLSPGEGVLRRQVVDAIGPRNFEALNATGQMPGMTITPGRVVVMIGPRQIAEAMVHYQQSQAARA